MPLVYCRKCDSLDEVGSATQCPRCGSALVGAEFAATSSEGAAQDGDAVVSAEGVPIEAADRPLSALMSGIDDSPCERGLLHLLASPSGRIGRTAYLGGCILLVFLAADVLLANILAFPIPELSVPVIIAFGVIAISLILGSIKRLHDFDQPGIALLAIGFCIGVFALLPLLFIPGTRGWNGYGSPSRFRWSLWTLAAVFLIVWSGAYSLIVVVLSDTIAAQIEAGRVDYEAGNLETSGQKYRSAYKQVMFGLRVCPCDHLRIQRMAAEEAQGFLLLQEKNWDDAIRWYKAARQTAESLKAAGHASEIAEDLKNINEGLTAALTQAGRYDEELAIRKESVPKQDSANLSHPEVRSMRWTEGLVLLKQGENEQARDLFAKLIEDGERRLKKDPADQEAQSDLAGALNNRGLARWRLADLNGARADFQEAIRLQTLVRDAAPGEGSYAQILGKSFKNYGMIFYEEQNIDQALEAFSSGLKADPDSVSLRKLVAVLRFERQEYAEVIELLERSLENSEDVSLEYLLVVCHLKRDEVDRAARVVDRLCTRHPASVQGRFLTGVIKLKKQDYSSAIEAFNAAIAIKPNEPAILYDLGLALHGSNRKADVDQAILQLRECNAELAAALERHISAPDSAETPAPVLVEMLTP